MDSVLSVISSRSLWLLAGILLTQDLAAAQRLSQFSHSVWRTQDGLFSSPNAIAQTADGYIWLGTDRGLVRFDGIRFVNASALTGLPVAEFKVFALLGTRDGKLWVGVPSNVLSIDGSKVTRYTFRGSPQILVEASDSSVWMTSTRGPGGTPVCRLEKGEVNCYGPPTIPMKHASALAQADDGSLWIGGSSALCHWRRDEQPAECFLMKLLEPLAGLDGVTSLVPSPQRGPVWVGISRSGPGLGVGTLRTNVIEPLRESGIDGSNLSVSSILRDREGAMWIGTFDEGIYRVQDHRVEHYGAKEGLSSNSVIEKGIFQDREGIVWVLTTTGVDSFRRQAVSSFSTREGLSSDGVESVLPLSNGDVWLGNTGLNVLRDDQIVVPEQRELFGKKVVTSLMEDSVHRIWIGLERTLQVYDGHTLNEVKSREGQSLGVVVALFEDIHKDVWASLVSGAHRLVRIRDRQIVEEIDTDKIGDHRAIAVTSDGIILIGYGDGRLSSYANGELRVVNPRVIGEAPIHALLPESNDGLIVATSAGLLIQAGGKRASLTSSAGLTCNNINAIVRDMAQALWIYAPCGITRIEKQELDRWLSDPSSKVRTIFLDAADGAQSGLVSSFRPSAAVGTDGRVWFATGKFAQVVDPAEIANRPALSVLVKIEDFVADRKNYSTSERISLPAATRDIAIRYTGLTFIAARKVQFAYQLEGRDQGWEDVGTRREAIYTDLPPGDYTFRVRAGFSDGELKEARPITFTILPLFYQTRWFLAVCIVVLILIIYTILLLRVRQVAIRLEQQMRARSIERERIARNLHDTLLQDTQALVLSFQTVAEQLPPAG